VSLALVSIATAVSLALVSIATAVSLALVSIATSVSLVLVSMATAASDVVDADNGGGVIDGAVAAPTVLKMRLPMRLSPAERATTPESDVD
jgi:hypothetical protein